MLKLNEVSRMLYLRINLKQSNVFCQRYYLIIDIWILALISIFKIRCIISFIFS